MFLLRQGEIDWTPAVDIYESDDSWLVFIELPGLTSRDIDLTVNSESIIVRGKKKPPVREYLAQKLEIYTGWFQREIAVPGRINTGQVTASMENGILKVVLPWEREKSVRIPVEGGSTGKDKKRS
ncbi:MAG: Hsp20/alpha crystallin family protein [Candidatus Fermentibacteraceae bacterium]|nr:Hsp20/alpha crystallin family protein [Candidatus Fermentibacteraceae bacterium]MBN2608738.1 Hsp20/alpha crystallin family protein [Candidatus Fermentibacteraceae bacterium]